MIRFALLGLVTVAMFVIAPTIGASSSVSIDPNNASSSLMARTVFDFAEEVKGKDGEELRERRERRREDGELEERRDDAERFFDNQEEED